jgi:hypothetical protein
MDKIHDKYLFLALWTKKQEWASINQFLFQRRVQSHTEEAFKNEEL